MDIVTNSKPRAPRDGIFQRDWLVPQKHRMRIRKGKCGNRVRGGARWELQGKERVDKVERGSNLVRERKARDGRGRTTGSGKRYGRTRDCWSRRQ